MKLHISDSLSLPLDAATTAQAILQALVAAYPSSLERDALSAATGYLRSSRDTYLQRLTARRLVTSLGRGVVQASDLLFEAGR